MEISSCASARRVSGTSGVFEGVVVDDVRILINFPLDKGLVDNVGASVDVVFDDISISIKDLSA